MYNLCLNVHDVLSGRIIFYGEHFDCQRRCVDLNSFEASHSAGLPRLFTFHLPKRGGFGRWRRHSAGKLEVQG